MRPGVPDRLLLATGNRHKLAEAGAILADLGISILAPSDVGGLPPVVEDGATFVANAIKKAESACRHTGRWSLADDSGLEAAALDGRPGVLSARFAGEGATDLQNTNLLLKSLRGVKDRRIAFRCVIALARPDQPPLTWEGKLEGVCLAAPVGQGGFGYDPVFFLPEHGKSVAELPEGIKNRISHRAQALAAFHAWLSNA